MKFITVSELRLRASEIIRHIESNKEQVIVTKKGKPVALIQFIDDNFFTIDPLHKNTDTDEKQIQYLLQFQKSQSDASNV